MNRFHVWPLILLYAGGIFLLGMVTQKAYGFNPVTDIQNNLTWTLGQTAQMGTAYKIAGSGALDGQRADSAMFGVFDYRFLSTSYGALSDPNNGGKFGDGVKLGLKLNYFLGWFKSPQTPVMQVLNNINIGPTYTVPVITSPRAGALWIEANYIFGK